MVHVASVLSFDRDPTKVIPTVVNGAINAASSAAKQSSVKRFVYTSSSSAITAPKPNVEFTISTDDWNTDQVEEENGSFMLQVRRKLSRQCGRL